jgi:hypothetical protein
MSHRPQVERARAQAAALPAAGEYSELCTALRRCHDEEVAISSTLAAQAGACERAEAAHARAAAALERASGAGGVSQLNGVGMVAALRDEVARLRQQVRAWAPRVSNMPRVWDHAALFGFVGGARP